MDMTSPALYLMYKATKNERRTLVVNTARKTSDPKSTFTKKISDFCPRSPELTQVHVSTVDPRKYGMQKHTLKSSTREIKFLYS